MRSKSHLLQKKFCQQKIKQKTSKNNCCLTSCSHLSPLFLRWLYAHALLYFRYSCIATTLARQQLDNSTIVAGGYLLNQKEIITYQKQRVCASSRFAVRRGATSRNHCFFFPMFSPPHNKPRVLNLCEIGFWFVTNQQPEHSIRPSVPCFATPSVVVAALIPSCPVPNPRDGQCGFMGKQ